MSADFQVLPGAGLILLMVLAPVYAWPETRKLTLPVFGFYVLFLFINSGFVVGKLGTGHDVATNWYSWSVIVQQWIQSDVELGWNPYWGAGQPFALYNNIFCYLPTVAFSKFFNLLGLELSPVTFFNLMFLFGYFNICTGALLLFRLHYKNSIICLFGFTTILFGGLFYAEIFESSLFTLCFAPYLLFLLIYFHKTRKPEALVFFCFVLGLSVNFFLPTYSYLTLLIFLFISLIAGLVRPGRLKEDAVACLKAMVSKPRMILLGLALFLCTAAPFIANYVEMQDYVSPTRGFSTDARPTQLSYQGSATTPISANSYLFDYDPNREHTRPESFLIKTHGTFYIGVLASLGFLIALFLDRNRIFICFSILLAVIAAGPQTPVWGWLVETLPLVDMTRHTFPFAKLAGLIIVTASLGGLTALADEQLSATRKIIAVVSAALILGYFFPKEWHSLQTLYFISSVAILIAISIKWPSRHSRILALSLPVLVAIQCLQLLLVSAQLKIPPGKPLDIQEIVYPEKWESLPGTPNARPFNSTSVVNKIPSWSHEDPNHLFMLQKDFAQFLLHNNLLVKKTPQESKKDSEPQGLALKIMKGNIFHLVPYREGADPGPVALQALKRIIGIHKPVLEVAGGSSDKTQLATVLDYDMGTAWIPVAGPPGNPPWIAFSIQEGFQPDQLEIRFAPGVDDTKENPIELWLSGDHQTWKFAQTLKRQPVPAGTPPGPFKFPLDKAITQKYFKLIFKGESSGPLAEVDLLEANATAPEPGGSDNLGEVHHRKSKSSNRVELDVTAKADAYLLRLENYHPGWQVLIDGQEAPILKVYPNFQMVLVPAGEHQLVFEFHSHYHRLVQLFVVTGFLGGAAFLFWLAEFNFARLRSRF